MQNFPLLPRTLSLLLLITLTSFGVVQAQQGGGLSLDALMGTPSSPAPGSPPASQPTAPQPGNATTSVSSATMAAPGSLSLDSILGGGGAPVQQDAAAASLDLGTIEAGRALVQQRNAFADLQAADRGIRSQCSCASSNSCFDLSYGLNYDQTIEAAGQAEVSLNEAMQTICSSWPGPGQAGQTLEMISTRMEIANKIRAAMSEVDSSANQAANQLAAQDNEIRRAIAAQQEAANPGFNWGQFAAMAVGAAAGGLGNLDPTQQAEILTSITMDSMNGGGSMSNFQGTMNSLNAELASMQQSLNTTTYGVGSGGYGYDIDPMQNYMMETQRINQAAEDIANALMGNPTSSSGGGGIGFDPAMRPGGVTGYDMVGNSSGIQGSSSAGGGGGGVINETYSFTCPSGTQANIPIVADSQACANAMKTYSKVMSCNLIDEMESAQRQYESACAAEIYQ